MSKKLINDFDSAMRNVYDAGLKLNPPYRAKKFLEMLNKSGGKETADYLLSTKMPSEGFAELYLRGEKGLKISLEYLVLTKPWSGLFTEAQLAVAKKRLTDLNCPDIPST